MDSCTLTCREPRWRHRGQLRRGELPPALAEWLLDEGSLTRRLQACCPQDFRVRVLGQSRGRPLPGEARALGLARRGYVWVREVHLLCNGHPRVFARTLIPPATLQGRARRLTRLGSRPLGEVLFTDPEAVRGRVEIARIRTGERLHRRAFGGAAEPAEAIWGRRSVFHLQGRPLLVCEIFLPGLPALPPRSLTREP